MHERSRIAVSALYGGYVALLGLAGRSEGEEGVETPLAVVVLIGLLWVLPPVAAGAAVRRAWLVALPSAALAPVLLYDLAVPPPGNDLWWLNLLLLWAGQTALVAGATRVSQRARPG